MKEAFSDFLRSLDGSRESPLPEDFERLWTALRAALRRELKRRGLWDLPPSYLGVSGRTSWSPVPGAAVRGPGRDDALDELAADAYAYVFLTRLDSLRAQLQIKRDVEGLVVLSLRSFLLERQRHFDPIGSRVYEVLRSAVRRAVAAEDCFVQAGDRRIGSDTILVLRNGSAGTPAADFLVAEVVREWADRLLPDLVTAVGRARRTVERRISEHLLRLPERGVETLRFGAFLNLLKIEVRARWAAIFRSSHAEIAIEDGEEDLELLVRSVRPDTSFEERQAFEELTASIVRELDRLDADERTMRYLLRLWGFLRTYALDDPGPRGSPPSRRQIAAELRIPRERLPALCATLGELIRKRRAGGTPGAVAVSPAGGVGR